MPCWHVFTQICHQLAKDSDGGYSSGYLIYPNRDPTELKELWLSYSLALGKDEDAVITQALEEFRIGRNFPSLGFPSNTQVVYSVTYPWNVKEWTLWSIKDNITEGVNGQGKCHRTWSLCFESFSFSSVS